jgi:hypothetical protein
MTPHRGRSHFRILGQPVRMLDQFAAGLGSEGTLAQPLDQLNPETGLQLPDLLADRRLAQVEPTRRRRKAPALHDLDKRCKLIEIEAPHLKVFLMVSIQ